MFNFSKREIKEFQNLFTTENEVQNQPKRGKIVKFTITISEGPDLGKVVEFYGNSSLISDNVPTGKVLTEQLKSKCPEITLNAFTYQQVIL